MHIYPKRASLEGLEIEVFQLVSYSATPEQWKEWLRVPLEHAAARGNLDLFNRLLAAGANGSAGWRGCRGRTLLDAGAVGGNVDVVSGLLEAGAHPDVKVVSSSPPRSALYTATVLGHESVARLLVMAGADVNFHDPVEQRHVLSEAIVGGHKQLVAEMLIGGANPNCQCGDDGATPLHFAASRGFGAIVSNLLLRGADKEARVYEDATPLMLASSRGRLSVVKTLMAAGADASVRDNDGFSALELAAWKGHCDIVTAIAGHGANVNACDEGGCTALHTAALYGYADAIDALIEAGADIELKTANGMTPLAYAADHQNQKGMVALLQHGAKVGVRDNDGDTPLHLVCARNEGLGTAVDLLLRCGADETALNNDRKTPKDILDVHANHPSMQDEVDRARLLLSRAPADRVWRRRGWLVMLRSAAAKVATSSGSARVIDGGGLSVAYGRRVGDGCQAGGTEQSGRSADHVARKTKHTDVGAGGGDSEGRVLGGVVKLLVGMEPEGVFRKIVGYL